MLHKINRLFFMLIILCFVSSAEAKSDALYELGKIPDINAIMEKNGDLFALFGNATVTDATDMFLKIVKLDLDTGKINCKTFRSVELGMYWDIKPCVSVRLNKDGVYIIDLVTKFKYQADVPIDFLKEEDFVKERRVLIHFLKDDSKCSVNVVERSYIPVDGKKPIPSRTGPGECVVKRDPPK